MHNGVRLARDDEAGRESLAQYVMRNPFSVKKITYNDATGVVIYRSKKNPRNTKGGRNNFQVFKAVEFIGAITSPSPITSPISAYYPDRSIVTHGHHFFSYTAKDTLAHLNAATPHDNGAEIIDQGLPDNLAAWVHAFPG